MERPLTAADRAPQIGDVIRGVAASGTVQEVRFVEPTRAEELHFEYTNGKGCGWWPTERFCEILGSSYEYITRADGGPITTEAPDAPQ